MRTVTRFLVLTAIAAVATGVTAADASAGKVHKQALYVRTVPTSSFYVDNGPSGNSAGDLFGSTGDLRRAGRRLGTYSSACTAASDSLGECHATFVFRDGLASNSRASSTCHRGSRTSSRSSAARASTSRPGVRRT